MLSLTNTHAKRCGYALLVFALLCSEPRRALADEPRANGPKQRIVVQDLLGPQGNRLRTQLVSSLRRHSNLDLVELKQVTHAARKLGLQKKAWDASAIAKIAKEVRADAVIEGRVRHRGREWFLMLTVRRGTDGSVVGSETWEAKTLRGLRAVGRNGYKKLKPHLDAIASGGTGQLPPQTPAAVPTEIPQPPEVPLVTEVPTFDNEPRPTPSPAPTAPAFVLERRELRRDQAHRTPAPRVEPPSDAPRYEAFSISFLGGLIHRSLIAQARVFTRYRDPNADPDSDAASRENRTYQSSGIGDPELGLQMDLYPGALLRRQVVPWLGVHGSFRHAVGINSYGIPKCEELPCADRARVPTKVYEFYGGPRFRFQFGHAAHSPVLTIDAGYGEFAFNLKLDALAQLERRNIIPPVHYRYALGGIGLSVPIVPKYLILTAEGSYRYSFTIGEDAKSIWGTKTGAPMGFAVGGEIRSEAPYILPGLYFSLTGQYFVYRTQFRGQTACKVSGCDRSDSTEPDLWEPWPAVPEESNDLTGGIRNPVLDQYFRVGLSVGYSFK